MEPLDNPIWTALNSRQAYFAEGRTAAKRFTPEVSPLGGISAPSEAGFAAVRELLVSGGGGIALFLPARPETPAGLETMMECPLLQMILENDAQLPPSDRAHEFMELGERDVPEMIELTALTKPGPFEKRTREMGTYLGIRKDGRLVAMAGERLKLPGYTEISAVCTHPDHLGHGYAGFLMTILAERIRARGEAAVLHVRPENARAISLYERLGFKKRYLAHLAVFRAAKSDSAQAASKPS
ncbi:MAG: GNAT family N-acetyltransferase [Candidatus Acidiferrales bacterium]